MRLIDDVTLAGTVVKRKYLKSLPPAPSKEPFIFFGISHGVFYHT
jgi:hypothetical protein